MLEDARKRAAAVLQRLRAPLLNDVWLARLCYANQMEIGSDGGIKG